jgi:uncharacterized protein
MPGRPTHFEIPVDDPDRAEAFYGAVFGWKVERFPGAPQYYGMATTGEGEDGINGALFQRGEARETSVTMGVDSIEDTMKQVESAGGTVVQGKTPIPGMGYFATCKDTEGNPFGLFTEDPNATM